jgi:divinyl chlorophyllide a 8-vinyl-reductase
MNSSLPAAPRPTPRAAGPRRILLLGATGTIGRATLWELIRRGHSVVCFDRPPSKPEKPVASNDACRIQDGALRRFIDVTDTECVTQEGFRGERFDVLVSCMASRTGTPKDAWDVDYQGHVNALAIARCTGVTHFVLLSAICVQKPMLTFQRAKLAFEKLLIESGLRYSIVRPTAFFKSLSGQVERVRRGKPYLVFGDGTITACKPIGDQDLAVYIAGCLEDAGRQNCILPIGGPGHAITPLQQAEALFALFKRPIRIRRVPIGLLDGIVGGLDGLGRWSPSMADKAEYARIGRYYATESMLVLNPKTGRYDPQLTPSTGTETLFEHYARLVQGGAEVMDRARP